MSSECFLGHGSESFTSNTTVVHVAPKTTSRTLLRGVLRDASRAYVRGMVKIEPGAKGSQAGFEARALMLSKHCRAECVPDLEIAENDVLGATHAASVAPVDEEQLFYLMSRGLTEAEASTMIVNGFVEPLIKELPMEYAVEMNRLIQLQMEGSVG